MPAAPRPEQSTIERLVLREIRAALKARDDKMSQNGLADAAGMSRSQLSNVLNGKKPALFSEVVALARVLGIDLPTLVEHAERQEK